MKMHEKVPMQGKGACEGLTSALGERHSYLQELLF